MDEPTAMSEDPEFDRDIAQAAAEIATVTGRPVEGVWRSISTRIQLEAEVDRLRAELATAKKAITLLKGKLSDARADLAKGERVQVTQGSSTTGPHPAQFITGSDGISYGPRERMVRPRMYCTCACNSGGFCGGCGHAGCGLR